MLKSPPIRLVSIMLFCSSLPLLASSAVPLKVTTHEENPGVTIPSDFLGLSYEKSSITEGHFRADNTLLLDLHRNLGAGVLRIGGNKVELSEWSAVNDPPKPANGKYVVTPKNLDDFYSFAKAINWRVIHGVNLASGKPDLSAAEVAYALDVGGPLVMAIEVGNEPDNYDKDTKKLREKGYSYDLYKGELEAALQVILGKNPGAPLAGPVTTSADAKWFNPFVSDFKDKYTLFTSHFYPVSNISKPPPTVEKLLGEGSKARAKKILDSHIASATAAGLRYRMAECNSSSMGGTDDVSDVFAAAVWGSDFLFDAAEAGASGINFHTILGTRGYTAIGFDKKSNQYCVRPLYYSMLLFKDACQGRVIPCDVEKSSNVEVHATLGSDGKIRVVLVNKEITQSASATVHTDKSRSRGELSRLIAPSPTERVAITYGGQSVKEDGKFSEIRREPVNGIGGVFQIELPACSVAVLTMSAP